MLISISQRSGWHWLPPRHQNPDKAWLAYERGTGEWSAWACIAFEKHLKELNITKKFNKWLSSRN